jgi:hypothetical protein
MTSQGNGEPAEYDVQMSQRTMTEVKQLHAQAAAAGKGVRFIAAFRQIIEQLRTTPLTFGEVLYHLPALRLVVCQGAVAPLLVDYAVHEDRPVVFIRGIRVLS